MQWNMNILRNFFIMLCMVAGCDKESHIDYSSFNIQPEVIPDQKQQGFIITNKCSPFKTPLDFKNLEYTSKALINSNWLSNPHYLEDINHLIYQFNQTHIKNANIFIQALNNSALIYKKNMIEVNIIKRKLQADIDAKLMYYQQELASINSHLEIIKKDEKQHLNEIKTIKNKIQEKQKYYIKLRRSLKHELQTILLDDDLTFDLISNIKFKYKTDKTLHCSKYLGEYQQITFTSPDTCIYYNKEELINKIPQQYQSQVNIVMNTYVPKLWKTMVLLNGYFESTYNKQVFDHYLQKDLMIANNNLAIKRTINMGRQSQHAIDNYVEQYNKLTMAMANNIDKTLLDDQNKVNISSMAFYEKLSPLRLGNKIKDPIVNFAILYNNKALVTKLTQEYATKILNEYPKELTFSIANNGNFILPKIRENNYKIIIDVKKSYSVIYNGHNTLTPPKDFSQQTPNTTSMGYNLNQIISQQLFKQWYNS
ncbi:hypothetical protein [Photobacterium piscicola]|nr:hypothetical protein [Photobacterium piscicola]